MALQAGTQLLRLRESGEGRQHEVGRRRQRGGPETPAKHEERRQSPLLPHGQREGRGRHHGDRRGPRAGPGRRNRQTSVRDRKAREEAEEPRDPRRDQALRVGKAAGVKRVAIFHHEPNHTDDFLDKIALQVAEIAPQSFMAREGLVVSVK